MTLANDAPLRVNKGKIDPERDVRRTGESSIVVDRDLLEANSLIVMAAVASDSEGE